METKSTAKRKRAAAVAAVAIVTAASVTAGSLFQSPDAQLPDDAAPSMVCQLDDSGSDDGGDAGCEEEDEEETKRGLSEWILRLPLAVRLLVVLPLWAFGSVLLAVGGALWPLLSPVLGRLVCFLLLMAALCLSFALSAKSVFPDLKLSKLFCRRTIVALLLGAAALMCVDTICSAVWDGYEQTRNAALSVGFLLVLSGTLLPFALREHRRRQQTIKEKTPMKPLPLVVTDAAGSFTITLPNVTKTVG